MNETRPQLICIFYSMKAKLALSICFGKKLVLEKAMTDFPLGLHHMISDTEPPISLKSPFGEDRIVELSIGSSSGANKNDDDDIMAPRVKVKGVKSHRSSRTTAAAAISTTSTSFGTSVVPDFQSGSLSQQPYLMVPNPGYTGLPPPSWPTPGCMGPPPPPPPPISIPHLLRNSSLLVDSETPGSSSTSPLSETASVPNIITKERLVPDGKTSNTNHSSSFTTPNLNQLDEYVQSHFLIDDDDDEFFWRAFKYRTSKRFSQMMSDIREGLDTTHEWLIPAYKKVLERYWETDEKWKNIRKKARENRASLLGGSVHCGGSFPLSSTIERMKKQLARTPTHEEVFKEIHTLKSDKSKWVDKRSQDTREKFIKKLAEVQAQRAEAQAQGMELQPIDEDLIWEEVCGGQKKNRVYRKGSFFSSSIKSGTTSANSVSGRAPRNQNSVPDLREQIYNLNEELFQRVTQQTDERISKLLDIRLAPLEKTQKKLEKLERAIGKAKKEKLKQKRWNEAYVSYYEKVRASSSSSVVPLPPPLPPHSMSSDEGYDDDEDEDDTEDYS
ncbi:hypothetical protein Ahy_A05g024517 [Arachis hypogaea]|uniref:Uncharacterized protein n=1 Tax=Arachis hypogaea TaxID=3818 RepID=A0A445D5Z4_ARAHY|nr:hypothetical protein Ahy_A05g024517 [Arachis hypogaea]